MHCAHTHINIIYSFLAFSFIHSSIPSLHARRPEVHAMDVAREAIINAQGP